MAHIITREEFQAQEFEAKTLLAASGGRYGKRLWVVVDFSVNNEPPTRYEVEFYDEETGRKQVEVRYSFEGAITTYNVRGN